METTNNTNTPKVEVIELNMEKINMLFKSLPKWTLAEENGYEPLYTFWTDFSIADAAPRFGEDAVEAIRMTFSGIVRVMRDDYKAMTELSMVLNHKIWEHRNAAVRAKNAGLLNRRDHHMRLAEEYDGAWRATDEWCKEHLKGEELGYYIDTTD